MNDNENWVKTYSINDIDDEDVKEFHLPNGNKIAVYNINNSLALSASINNSLTSNVSCFDFCDGIISLNVSVITIIYFWRRTKVHLLFWKRITKFFMACV